MEQIISVRLDDDLFMRLEMMAKREGDNVSAQIRQALEEYYAECGSLPTTEQGLKALWEKPYLYPVPSKWNGPYLDTEIPPDPWGNEYQYKTPGPNNLPYEIFSFGADGEKGGEGKNADIYSWKRRE